MAIGGVGGIGSGLDVNNIVKSLVEAERAPKKAQLDRLEKKTTTSISALGSFRNAISTFQTALNELNDPALFTKRSARSSDTSSFTATADKTAASGNYNIQVFNLAQTSRVALAGQDNASDPVGTGTLSIGVGSQTLDIDVTAGNDSLTAIRDAINTQGSEIGISATIVTDPGGAGGSRLVLSSNQAGTGNDITVTASTDAGDTGDLNVLAFTPPATTDFVAPPQDPNDPRAPRVISYARDANIAIDGITVSSASNTIDEAIEGVSITLKAAQSAEDQTNASTMSLGVSEDRAGVRSALEKFVEAYNALSGTMSELTSVTRVGGDDGEPLAAPLVGDASVRSFSTSMRNAMGSVVGDGDLRMLADLGIATKRDGTLEINQTRMNDALDNNFDQVAGLLTGDDGLLKQLNTVAEPYTQRGGVLESRTTALQNTLTGVDDQRESLTRRIGQLEARLLSQFNAMDSLVAQLNQTSDYLTNQLSNLPGVVRQDNRR
ncbi:flagellar filament capping protein FliD [Halopseudomonas salegens]|uniref:Flagellar hook-associated protein 2 n=1 Tax=Halopseudomonas salegens TaxID=1434072 RepID=A0A1H2G4I3_9GAMM|nr:flagellar filament capping protein FliD [Halopseudomonas salegens]SDU14429.1 flagellar hook-associated protein 2 [Halopseudomonas salegens]